LPTLAACNVISIPFIQVSWMKWRTASSTSECPPFFGRMKHYICGDVVAQDTHVLAQMFAAARKVWWMSEWLDLLSLYSFGRTA
jgi:hypothetical protein